MDVATIIDRGLGNASYLVDLGNGGALAIDPARDPRPYLEEAARRGLRITLTVDTHLHNDFVSGSRELRALGAEVLASAGAALQFPHRALADGDDVDLGGLTLRAIGTPGHTPEHLAYLLSDGTAPRAVFTGGSLLRGSVGRTDLLGPEYAEPLARALYRSVRERLLTLPADLRVYPTHGAGPSFCVATPTAGSDPSTTIGLEQAGNVMLQAPDEGSFARELLAGYGGYPRYFRRLREINRAGARVFGDRVPELGALGVAEVQRLRAEGARVVDVRPVDEFAAGHIPGSLSIVLRPAFATWLGSLVPAERPLVFVLSDGQDRAWLVRQCLNIAFERLAGELAGGMAAWRAAGLPERVTPIVDAAGVTGAFVDVRQLGEFASGHIPGAHHVELGTLEERAGSLPEGPLAVHCARGERAMSGASLLEGLGRDDVSVLVGGPEDWSAASGRPLERGASG